MRSGLLAILAAFLACIGVTPAAAANLVLNGDFEMLTMTSGNPLHSTIIGNGSNGLPTATNWRSSDVNSDGNPGQAGYNFIMVDDPSYIGFVPALSQTGADDFFGGGGAYTTGAAGGGGRFHLWGPDYVPGSNNGLTNSPTGGNYLAADGSYLNRPVEQTITGMVVGQTYYLSFYWATAQQGGFDGATTEGWRICLGTCSYHVSPQAEDLAFFDADFGDQDTRPGTDDVNELGFYDPLLLTNGTDMLFRTGVRDTPNHGFQPWQFESFSFVATSTTATLSLLAYGTPIGQPPFALIDGITIDTPVPQAVPEPTTWAMMLIGFGVIGGVLRKRRPLNDRRALNKQII